MVQPAARRVGGVAEWRLLVELVHELVVITDLSNLVILESDRAAGLIERSIGRGLSQPWLINLLLVVITLHIDIWLHLSSKVYEWLLSHRLVLPLKPSEQVLLCQQVIFGSSFFLLALFKRHKECLLKNFS